MPVERALGGGLVRGVDLFDGDLAAERDGQVGGRAGGDRHAQRVAVELALELRQHQADGLRGARGGRDDVQRGGAGTAEVAVRRVLQVLVLRVRVDRGHEALLDAEAVVQDLGQRREAVRGAGRVRDDRLRTVVLVLVRADDDGEVLVLGRRGDDDLLGATLVDVLARALVGVGEEAGRLDDDVDAEVLPRQLAGVALGEGLDDLAVDRDALVGDLTRRAARRPRMLSYFSRCAMVATSPRSLNATISMSWPPACTARKKLRPMRPKPLTPTRTVTTDSLRSSWQEQAHPICRTASLVTGIARIS